MNEITTSLGPAGLVAVQLLVKVALVVGIAWAICIPLRRASAGARHLVWTGAVLAFLALPALTVLLPVWELAIVPASHQEANGASAGTSALPEVGPIGGDADATAAGAASFADPSAASGSEIGGQTVSPFGAGAAASSPVDNPDPAGTRGGSATSNPNPPTSREVDWLFLLFVAWMVGTGLLLMRIFYGWWGLRGFARDAEPVTNGKWLQLLKDARWLLGVERPVRLLQSRSATMPVTWGTLRPAVLLPADASDWSEERLRMVLLHEVAHVARYDCLTQMFAGIGCALYWFHPLTWVAARRLRVERERACDDMVLAAGERASEYASHLLEVARSFRPAAPVDIAAIAMARPSQLEGRLLAVLDTAKRRRMPSLRARISGLATAVVLLIPLAAAQAVSVNTEPFVARESLDQTDVAATQASREGALQWNDLLPTTTPSPSVRPTPVAHPVPTPGAADSIVELRIAAIPGGVVALDIESGASLEVVGWDRNEVSVQGQLTGDHVHELTVDLVPTADGVRLVSRFRTSRSNRNSNIRFHILVPTRSDVALRSGGGDVTMSSISGSLSGGTGGGNLNLSGISGRAELHSGGGNVSVKDSELEGTVTTGGGNITLAGLLGGLQATTGGGNITIVDDMAPVRGVVVNPSLWLQYVTGGGNITVDGSPFPLDIATGGGAIRIGAVGGGIRARTGGGEIIITDVMQGVTASTGSGRVSIGRAAGPVRVSSGSGAVDIGIAPASRYADIDIEAGSGSVTLTLPADFSGRFDIEGSRSRRADIVSDFPINVDSDGRATGQIGNGANLVRIRTSNGSVRIRRAGQVAGLVAPSPLLDPRTNVNLDERPELRVTVDHRVRESANTEVEAHLAVAEAANTAATKLVDVDIDAMIEHALSLAEHSPNDPKALNDFLAELGTFTASQTARGLDAGFRAAAEALRRLGDGSNAERR